MSTRKLILSAILALLLAPAFTMAQTNPDNSTRGQGRDSTRGDSNRSDRGGRGNFDPARMREMFETRIKEQMNVSDDEWKVIQPKLTKVMDARRDASGF